MPNKDPEKIMNEKMGALKELSLRTGMIGPLREIKDSLGYEVEVNKPLVLLTLIQYLRDDITIWQKQACAAILDYYIPAWREIVPEILGPIVGYNSKEVKAWRQRVLERDQSKCIECGSEDGVKVYRIMSWSEYPDLRLVMENGKSVCNECLALARKEYRLTKRSDTHE